MGCSNKIKARSKKNQVRWRRVMSAKSSLHQLLQILLFQWKDANRRDKLCFCDTPAAFHWAGVKPQLQQCIIGSFDFPIPLMAASDQAKSLTRPFLSFKPGCHYQTPPNGSQYLLKIEPKWVGVGIPMSSAGQAGLEVALFFSTCCC